MLSTLYEHSHLGFWIPNLFPFYQPSDRWGRPPVSSVILKVLVVADGIIDVKRSSISKSVAHLLEIRTGFKEVSRHLNTSIGYLKASLTISRILILNLLNGTTVIRVSHSI